MSLGGTIFHSFPQLRHGTSTIPFLCDAGFLPINLGAIFLLAKKSTCTQIPLSAQPDLASMQSLSLAWAQRARNVIVHAPGEKVWRLSCRLYIRFEIILWRLDKTVDAVLEVVIARFSQCV